MKRHQPPQPKVKLTEPEIAGLYNGCRYRNIVVPREPLWRPPMPDSARVI